MLRSFFTHPLTLAAAVTLANAAKPVAVDDAAYLLYARQIAEHPFDPYGFSVFWYAEPEPAMAVLAPPVVPYWLALGLRIFGDSPPLLKLWLFPFVWVLAWSLRALLRRFARGAEGFALPLLMLSPAVLPTVNLMLDVPAAALALAAVEVFIRAADRRSVWLALAAGVIGALAMQTKYTAFVAPAVFAWYGVTHRRVAIAAAAAGVSVALFAGWELILVERYGQSHFLAHARGAAAPPAPGAPRLRAFVEAKCLLIGPHVAHLGCLAAGVGLLAWSALRVPRRWLARAALAWCVGLALTAALPPSAMGTDVNGIATAAFWYLDVWSHLARYFALPHRSGMLGYHFTLTATLWHASGWCWVAGVAGCAAAMLFRPRRGLAPRRSAGAWFVVGWLAIEVAASLALTPFPAARRVIGVALVAGIVAARAAGRVARAHPERRAPRWLLGFGVLAGVAVALIDTQDARPEKECAEAAAAMTCERPETSTVWFAGHWGFQYYCERAGMKPLVAGVTRMRAGDFVVLPAYPDGGFNRPHAGFEVVEPVREADVVGAVVWDDWLRARTVPNFYGGVAAVEGREHPRLVVRVYRLREDWVMGWPGTPATR
jgi:hypothetical protein